MSRTPGATPRILPFGEDAFLVSFGDEVDAGLAHRARACAREVEALRAADPRWGPPVAAAASVLVPFDPLALDAADAAARLAGIAAHARGAPPGGPAAARVEMPVRYGGPDGPDLASVADQLGVHTDEVVAAHAAAELEVLFLGFAPGFAYLGPLPDALVVPRLSTPRTAVPAGSVAIAGRCSAVYPQDSPGGWRIIGRADLRLFDPSADPPARLRPGDRVRFVPA